MGKKILYIILGALLVFGLIFLLWSWFFSGSTKSPTDTGSLGSAGDTTQNTGAGTGSNTNGQNPLGDNTNGSQPINNGQNTSGSVTNNTPGSGAAIGTTGDVPGVNFLPTDTGFSAGNGFTPISINGVANGFVGGSVPTIQGGFTNTGNGGIGAGSIFLGAGIAGAVSCGLRAAALANAAAAGATAGGVVTGVNSLSVPVRNIGLDPVLATNSTAQTALQTGDQATGFQACLLNTIAKAALAQITASVVNWINGGFNGSPSFVTNYNQFFTNVADAAAGQFIQGAGLAFLCSPFQLQIKIAIAQSYANRNAQSCTLTGIIKNINGFMNGNFSQGGWGGFVSFTTVPTNNPYGAFAYAQAGLASAQQNALNTANKNISPTGFIGLQQQSCSGQVSVVPTGGLFPSSQAAKTAGICPVGCTCKTTTPGSVIESSLTKTLGSGVDQLGLASSLDQIMNALVNQLMVRTLYSGLGNLSGVSGYQSNFQSPEQLAAQQQAQAALTDMQNKVVLEQQLGAIAQGSIGDIQSAQAQLSTLLTCWNTAAASPTLSSAQTAQASANASSTQGLLLVLNVRAQQYNDQITQINNQIASLQQLQTEALNVSSAADVATLNSDYASAQTSGGFATSADITTAQQNRTSLQAEMATQNSSTQSNLTQCNAMQ